MTTVSAVHGIATAAAVVLLGVATPTAGHAATPCHRIDALGAGVASTSSDGATHTTATISDGGLLTGSTEGLFTVTGASGNVLSIAGTIDFTTRNGATLHVAVTGSVTVNADNSLDFTATTTDDTLSGTGRLSDPSGTLTFAGHQNPDGRFTETVRGSICADLAP